MITTQQKKFEVIDLFSGCGGLALGFKKAGLTIMGGMELNEPASITASYNLHWKDGIDKEHLCGDLTLNSPEIFKQYQNPVIIGGPPCQAYSLAGRAKLNSLGEERAAFNDSRGFLYQDFLRFVLDLKANAVVMENVPESVNYNGKNIPENVCEILTENGYNAVWTVLNSADYGVPQIRERVFVIAVKKEFGDIKNLPVPTHQRPDKEYRTMNEQRFPKFKQSMFFRIPNLPQNNLPYWVTVGEALSDLPSLFPKYDGIYTLHPTNLKLKYNTEPRNDFQYKMRLSKNKVLESVSGNGFRNTKRDFIIFNKMKANNNYRDAHDIAMRLLADECRKNAVTKKSNPEKYAELKKKIVPPYSIEKFLGKWRKLDSDKPSHTLVAHLSTDTYSHIHPWEPRGISVREAARLQSFPDDFYFNCSMTEAFKQIGNAVPPLLAQAVAEALLINLQQR